MFKSKTTVLWPAHRLCLDYSISCKHTQVDLIWNGTIVDLWVGREWVGIICGSKVFKSSCHVERWWNKRRKDANLSTTTVWNLHCVPPRSRHQSFLPLTMSWTSARDHGALKERRRKSWGRVFCFLALSLLCDLMTLPWTRPLPLPPLHFLTPLTFSPAQSLNTFIFFWDMSQHENGRDKRNMWTRSAHLLSLLCLFFLHLAYQCWWSINRLWPPPSL